MALTLFVRRPEPVEAPAPELWPEIGETWKPEGISIVERYYNLGHAVVLVYSADRDGYYHLVSCLGCHYLVTRDKSRTYNTRYRLEDAARVANEHASICRALPRELPARPDDDTARRMLHTWVLGLPRRDEDFYLDLWDFDSGRLELQRTNKWMQNELVAFAAERGDVLSAKPSDYGSGINYTVLRQPS
ncbi:hypothetical protein OG709_35810 (plasmid) [Streptomyces sp. NBC_01267]|uniref:hypothetical protein n=1 Tax=Streptomyces sp. NBC_01267 TaxID=2903805 RepID=UPI002E2FDC52|nr:hypothetical protein [Streptomyces sp. NBC_01267]